MGAWHRSQMARPGRKGRAGPAGRLPEGEVSRKDAQGAKEGEKGRRKPQIHADERRSAEWEWKEGCGQVAGADLRLYCVNLRMLFCPPCARYSISLPRSRGGGRLAAGWKGPCAGPGALCRAELGGLGHRVRRRRRRGRRRPRHAVILVEIVVAGHVARQLRAGPSPPRTPRSPAAGSSRGRRS